MNNQLKITLIGYGKMGKTIHNLITEKFPQITHVSYIDQDDEINIQNCQDTDLFIDFTVPNAFIPNLRQLLKIRPNAKIVVGTTGWYDQIDSVKDLITNNPESALIYSGNFSIGINLFWNTIKYAARQFSKYSDLYDTFGHEIHHNQKADSPGGTAKHTAELLLNNFPSKKQIKYDLSENQINPNDLHFTSTRGGHVIGIHSVFFDSSADTIEITHTARNREGFALGAIKSALWVKNKTGFYTINDFINSYIND